VGTFAVSLDLPVLSQDGTIQRLLGELASRTSPTGTNGWELRLTRRGSPPLHVSLVGSPSGPATRIRQLGLRAAAKRLISRLSSPRRALDEELIALIHLLGTDHVESTKERLVRQATLDRLSNSPPPRTLASAALEAIGKFSVDELTTLGVSPDVVVRLLPLTRQALEGNRAALDEILVLSLEYHGDATYFRRALESLLAKELNPELHARHPRRGDQRSDRAFLRDVRNLGAGVRFAKKSWVVNPPGGAP